jgi:adenylate kinase
MDKIIVLIGAPGAGKGTQARLLQTRCGIPQISTGDMFREMKELSTPLAQEIKEIMASGNLISDELTLEVVKERVSRDDCKGTFILDGYPRTAVQAKQLEQISEDLDKPVQAILVDVPLEQLEKRMTGRRSCPVCGEIYNIYFKSPKNDNVCDFHPDTELKHRADDYEDKVKVRLAAYQKNTAPLIEYYENSDRLARVSGEGDLEEIYAELEKLV